MLLGYLFFRHCELYRFGGDHCVSRIGQLDENSVRFRRQSDKNNRFTAGIDKVPWQVVERDVDVTDTRGHGQRAFPEDWHYA
jgi:hypothetical protein